MAEPSVNAPTGVVGVDPEIQKDPVKFGTWLASQNLETQNYYVWNNPAFNGATGKSLQLQGSHGTAAPGGAQKSSSGQVVQALYKERARLFVADPSNPPPGVNPQGQGIPASVLTDAAKARASVAGGQSQIQGAVNEINQLTPESFTVNPVLDQGPGYQLTDRLQQIGHADPLKDQLNLDAINQVRSDTTGVDAQKDTLLRDQDILNRGGLDAMDRARMAQAHDIRAAQARGNEQAIRADAEERGRSGGRLEFLLRQQAQQQATGQLANDDLQTQALALARRNEIMGQQASVGGQVQSAQDIIDAANTKDLRDVRDTGNQATESTWNENNTRDKHNNDVVNQGVTNQWGYDTGLSARNVGAQNAAETINKGPSGGLRGLTATKLAGAGAAAGHGDVVAGFTENLHNDRSRETQAQDALTAQAALAPFQIAAPIAGKVTESWLNPKKTP